MEVEEPAAVVRPSGNLEQEFSHELLKLCAAEPAPHRPPPSDIFRVAHGRYYARIFPAELMCKWLGYGTQNEKSAADNLLCRREFSFTTGDDVYIRYLSYGNADALRKVRPNPHAHP